MEGSADVLYGSNLDQSVQVGKAMRLIAQFEKGIAGLVADMFCVLILFDDGSQACLLPDPETLMREKSFASVVH